MHAGQIYRHDAFYLSSETGALQAKYFVILALNPAGDIVARLLTSRAHGRPELPPCYHGDPYPGYYLGVIGSPLAAQSWVDLRGLNDFDQTVVQRKIEQQRIRFIRQVPLSMLSPLLECAASADDTTRLQELSIRNCLATLR